MSDWFTVAEISGKINVPQQTIRRYITTHSHLLRIKKEHKSYQLHEDCIGVLTKMRGMYKSGKTSEEIDKLLTSSGIPITIDVVDESGEHVNEDVSVAFADIKKSLEEQKKFNENLLKLFKEQAEKLDAQQKYIEESLKRRDEALLIAMRETQANKQLSVSAQASEHEEKDDLELKKDSWFKNLFKR